MNNNITLTDFLSRVSRLEVIANRKELYMGSWLQEDEYSLRFSFFQSGAGLTYVFKEQVSFGYNEPVESLEDILGLLDKAEAFLASYTTPPIEQLQEEIEKMESELAAKREALDRMKKY